MKNVYLLLVLCLPTFLSAQRISEVLYDAASLDGSGGEWFELGGEAGANLGCYIISDGDWTITLPAGTVFPGDGTLLIASGTKGDLGSAVPDVDIDLCNCFSTINPTLTNSGEFIGLFGPDGTLLDGIIFENPTGNNKPNAQSLNPVYPLGCMDFGSLAIANVSDITMAPAPWQHLPANTPDGTSIVRDAVTDTWSANNTPSPGTSTTFLPVELTTFTASTQRNSIALDWTTDSELNNDYFIVEQSIDGESYKEIGRVNGNGNTYKTSRYSFVDYNAQPGFNYYRLKQVDFDGGQEFSNVVVAKMNTMKMGSAQIYPNPVGSVLNVRTASMLNARYKIIGFGGQIALEGMLNEGSSSISLGELASGVYTMQLTSDKETQVLKFVKR